MDLAPYSDAIYEVVKEAARTQDKFGDFASMHEAYGVLAEEFAELFDAVRMRQNENGIDEHGQVHTRGECIRDEAIQVAAVALRIAMQAGKVTR